MPELLCDGDIHYTFNKDHAVELGLESFKYEVWNCGVLICFDTVCCHSRKDFEKLLEHWSKSSFNWNYNESTEK